VFEPQLANLILNRAAPISDAPTEVQI
jgi:hypothetical protein